jgi:AraC-like DNA-binding protein
VQFDAEESAVVFARHWLDAPLPPVSTAERQAALQEVQQQRAHMLADFPTTLRRMLRKQLLTGRFSMDDIAGQLGMHRRTLDRHLNQSGVHYGELVESLKEDVARQLLLDTRMPIQQIAETVRFSSAANFATAFRRRSGMTPSAFRRSGGVIRPVES